MWQSSDTLYDPRLARGGDIEKVKGECEMKEIVIPEMNETEKPVDVNEVYQKIISQIPDGKAVMLTYPPAVERYYGATRLAAASRRGHYGRQGVRMRRVGETQLLVWHKYGKKVETLVAEHRATYIQTAEGVH